MNVELQINNSTSTNARFVGWTPSPCRIRVTNPSGTTLPSVTIELRSVSSASGGAIAFRKGATGAFFDTIQLNVPVSGTSVPFFVAGKFGRPSVNNGDVRIEARAKLTATGTPTTLVGSVRLMVRIRKNAEKLTTGERDRFIAAFATLNNQGLGRFADFRNMHPGDLAARRQAHGAAGFLPWHRAYLLDLERELQAIDPSVTLPYWRFDQAAPKLFTRDFIGVSGPGGAVQFSNTNPLQFWKTDGVQGITRMPINPFDPQNPWDPSTEPSPIIMNEADTLNLGNTYAAFRGMEGNPHANAHGSWDGFISVLGTAAKDPLFFLLHCNVDRLWARWQRLNSKFDPAQATSYDSNPNNPVGHNLTDTMWPWNGVITPPRPPTAPGGPLALSPCASAPGTQPQVQNCLDYQGTVNALSRQGFDYDDVRFV